MTPRTRFTSAPYALRAGYADSSAGTSPWTVSGSDVYRAVGNVGIGTASPDRSLTVTVPTGVNDIARFRSDNGNSDLVIGAAADSVAQIYTLGGQGLSIGTNGGVERMRITSAGNIGIGTSTPTNNLEVRGNATLGSYVPSNLALNILGPNSPADQSSYQDMRFSFAAAGSSGIRGYRGSSWDTYLQFLTNDVGQGTDAPQVRMHIGPNGMVGIGTTTPAGVLHVVGDILLGGTGEEYIIHPRTNVGGDFLQITDRDAGGDWKFGQGIVLHSNGNVGIGTASPTAKLHVVGDLCVTGSKNAIVPTSKGMTKFYCEEAAESWFSDYGEVQLVDGHASVSLDPVVLEAVNIDSEHPMQIQLQEYDVTNGLVVKRGASGFEIIEKNNGCSNGKIGFRIAAKRKGYENARLEVAGEMVAK